MKKGEAEKEKDDETKDQNERPSQDKESSANPSDEIKDDDENV